MKKLVTILHKTKDEKANKIIDGIMEDVTRQMNSLIIMIQVILMELVNYIKENLESMMKYLLELIMKI